MKLKLTLFILSLWSLQVIASPQTSETENTLPTKPLKIAYVIDSYDQLKSGAIISANRFIRALKQNPANELTIIATGAEEEGKARVRGFYIPLARNKMKRNGMKFGRASSKELRKVFADADIVYIHFPFLLGIKAMRIAKSMGKPVVVGFHLQPENMLFNIGIRSQIITKKMYRIFIDRFYNKADMVICPSEFARDLLEKYPSFKAKTTIISNGLTDEFRPNDTHTKSSLMKQEAPFTVLTVGRLSEEKRHETIIKAIKKSKFKDHIQLIATGDGALRESLIALGRKLPRPPQIGYVSNDDLIRLYNTSDLYVHASAIELEGMSVLEAIGCGLPAIISDAKTSASRQFALSPEFLFEHDNVNELSAKIDYWFEHRAELKQKGLEYAESAKAYYFEASVAQMEKVLADALAANNKRAS